jgi:hypothetical protein
MEAPRPFATPEAAREWFLREGFALVTMPCAGCGEICYVALPPATMIPRGLICPECQAEPAPAHQKN